VGRGVKEEASEAEAEALLMLLMLMKLMKSISLRDGLMSRLTSAKGSKARAAGTRPRPQESTAYEEHWMSLLLGFDCFVQAR